MPKILINEKDRTSPGTPDRYANYAVLLAGFSAKTPQELLEQAENTDNKTVKPDSNGAYEFTNHEDFYDTIGLVPPTTNLEIVVDTDDGPVDTTVVISHYGNQMAYELLRLGYTVIYVPITKETVSNLKEPSFWAPFKDKASYDFRFISHGLLTSSPLSALGETKTQRLYEVDRAIRRLVSILAESQAGVAGDKITIEEVVAGSCDWANLTNLEAALNAAYEIVRTSGEYTGFTTPTGDYDTFKTAAMGTASERETLQAILDSMEASGVNNALIAGANEAIAKLAAYIAPLDSNTDSTDLAGRGDCIALIELDEAAYLTSNSNDCCEKIIAEIDKQLVDAATGKYCAVTVPSVYYKMAENTEFNNNTKFPGAFHYLACFINSLKLGFAEWYAAAGYTRGISSLVVDNTTIKLGEIAINALEPRNNDGSSPKFAVNVIANFRGSYYLWGNRTAHTLDTNNLVASHFLNIRQLCTTIKKQLYVACRRFTFDPNSDTLWINFVNAIRPTLEMMKADQGIRDYKVVKVYTDKKATLKAKIRIIPIEAVEDFDLEISLEDSFGDTAVNAIETM